jgi:hypothetical protein
MNSLVDMWRGFESKEAWVKAGNLLFTRFVQKKNQDMAMRVARTLMNAESLSPTALAQLTGIEHGAGGERKPASVRPKDEDPRFMLDSYEEEE